MELRFRHSQQDEDVFAPILLKKGSSVDDSMKVFEAIGSSGGLKKALMSFTVGVLSQFSTSNQSDFFFAIFEAVFLFLTMHASF